MFKRLICLAFVVLVFGWGGPFAFGQENQIQNGEFDDDLNSWGIYGGAGFSVNVVEDGALSGYNAALIDVTNAGAGTMIGIAQGELQFEQGKTYTIGLTARASQAREMVILIQKYVPNPDSWTDLYMTRVPLTTEPQTFVYEYTHTDTTTTGHADWSLDIYYMLKGPHWSMSGSGLNCKVWLDRLYIGEEPPPQGRYRAAGPADPADGATIDNTAYTLKWIPGDLAASHTIYFSDDFNDVNEARVAAVSTTKPEIAVGMGAEPHPQGLTPGTTYYWRVDEINEANPESPWMGNVWSFLVRPRTAWQPDPADGAQLVRTDRDLAWQKGLATVFHQIHFGESFDQVNDAPLLTGWPTVAPAHDPGPLKSNTTYYWRVDAFDGAQWYKGPVWSFTTVPEVAITDPDLAGWWTLDEGTGPTAIDWSGHGGHGILIGGPQWVDGYYGGALEFDGDGQYVDCGTNAGEGVTGDFTLGAWVQLAPSNAGLYEGIAGRLTNPGSYMGFVLVRHSTNVFRLWVGDGSTDLAKSGVSSDLEYTDTEWHHVAGVREGQGNFLYVDGVKQASTTETGFAPSAEFFHIGRQYSHLDERYFAGKIDDVRVYSKALDEAGIQEIMRGDPLPASEPEPAAGAIVDIRNADRLRWQAGDTAASHDVYFGTEREAVAGADKDSAEYQGNQAATSFSLAGLVEFGGGDYYWRIDEVEADGTTIHKGYTWRFTVPAYLIVDDFESYVDDYETGDAIFEVWLDGATNNTGSTVGYWEAPFAERIVVHSGGQSMPLDYNNVNPPYYSEAERTWNATQDWTIEGVDTLVLYVRGDAENGLDTLYVAMKDDNNKVGVVANPNPDLVKATEWVEWRIPLADFGVNAAKIKTMYIGLGDRDNPTPGGAGLLYIDDIRVVGP